MPRRAQRLSPWTGPATGTTLWLVQAELQIFVREALAKGLPREAIRAQLAGAGWRPEEVEAALGAFAEADFPVPVPRRRPYLSAREAFFYLVLFATLYTSAFNTGAVLFGVLDGAFPDAMRPDVLRIASREFVRGATAALLIAFPVFLFVSGLIGRAIAREPAKRGSPIRKWLTYLTLFIAALVIIGDLTFLVQRLLAGELPPRLLLKALVVLGIAGTVFGYYLGDLRGEEREGAATGRGPLWLGRLAATAVAVTIALGLFSSGSPQQARMRDLDARRVRDLRAIWAQLETERREGRDLPRSLEELAARPSAAGLQSLGDPESREPYGYRLVDSVTVELCARFASVDSLTSPDGPPGAARFWRHQAGRQCFTLKAQVRPLPVVR